MPTLSPPELQALLDRLLTARERFLAARSVQSILADLDRTMQLWLDPASPERREAEAALPEESGFSADMVHYTLPLIFQEYRTDRLTALLRDELGDPAAVDTFIATSDGRRRAYGPRLITQVLAGNLPGAGLDGVIFALLVKSATLVKASSSAPLLPTLFARSLVRAAPDLGACVAVVTWPGGNTGLEEIAFSRAEVVLASGSDDSLAAIRQRVRGRFIGYGHKISFGLVTKEVLSDTTAAAELARLAAYDVALFDQQGCLSPQLVYVEEGGAVTPQTFALLLARALEHWESSLPRGRMTAQGSLAVRRVRDEAEWQALAGKSVVLHASAAGTAWSVIYDADPTFVPSPLYRTVRVKPLSSLDPLDALLSSWRPYLEAVGLAASPHRLVEVAEWLGRAGVSRICPLGTMQAPPLGWRHGGRPRLADLVRWVGVEA